MECAEQLPSMMDVRSCGGEAGAGLEAGPRDRWAILIVTFREQLSYIKRCLEPFCVIVITPMLHIDEDAEAYRRQVTYPRTH
jgi:hypothetical protein